MRELVLPNGVATNPDIRVIDKLTNLSIKEVCERLKGKSITIDLESGSKEQLNLWLTKRDENTYLLRTPDSLPVTDLSSEAIASYSASDTLSNVADFLRNRYRDQAGLVSLLLN